MTLPIVEPSKALEKLQPVTEFPIHPQLIEDMAEAMKALKGVGLAAPQVGVNMELFIFDVGLGVKTVANPRLLPLSQKGYWSREGCLTLPGQTFLVPRFNTVRLLGQDENGEELDWVLKWEIGRVCQHEFDHIYGRLINGEERQVTEA